MAVAACSADIKVDTQLDAPVSAVAPSADYAVYAVAIDSLVLAYRRGRELIILTPTVSVGPGRDGAIESTANDASLPEDLRTDFLANNQRAIALYHAGLTLHTQFTILSRDSADALQDRARQERREGRPVAPLPHDLVELSRVGFSRDSSRALVYLGHICGGGCGTGYAVALRREAGSPWRIVKVKGLWIA